MKWAGPGGGQHPSEVKQRICAMLSQLDQCLRFPPFDHGWICRGDPARPQWWDDSPKIALDLQLNPRGDDGRRFHAPKGYIPEKPDDPDIIAGFCDKLGYWFSELLSEIQSGESMRIVGRTLGRSLQTTVVALKTILDSPTNLVAREFLGSNALKPGQPLDLELERRRDLAIETIRESFRHASQLAGSQFLTALAELTMDSEGNAKAPRSDNPSTRDVENIRFVMGGMAKNPSIEAIRKAVKGAGYRMSATKIGKAVRIIRES